MENSHLPPTDCILHGKQDWEAKDNLAIYPLLLPLVEEAMYVLADLQVQFELSQHTKVLYIPDCLWGRGCGPS